LSRNLDQETAKRLFWFTSQTATCYYQSIFSKAEAIRLNTLPKHTTSGKLCRPIFTLSLFYAERQAGNLWIPTFKVFWSDSARDSNTNLTTAWPTCPPP